MPAYEWKCRVCDESNDSGDDSCTKCGAKSDLSAWEIQKLRKPDSSFWSFLFGAESLAYLKGWGKLAVAFGLIVIVKFINREIEPTAIGYLATIALFVVTFLLFKNWWKYVRKIRQGSTVVPKGT